MTAHRFNLLAATATVTIAGCLAISTDHVRERTAAMPRPSAGSDAAARPALDAGPPGRSQAADARSRDRQLPANDLELRQRRVVATVRRFLVGYLALESGTGDRDSIRTVRATATPELARQLLNARPRTPLTFDGRPPAGREVGITGEFDKPPTTFAARALIDRDGHINELGLTLHRRASRWLINDLTE